MSGQSAYFHVIQEIVKHGRVRSPRGESTLDLGYTVIELDSPMCALPIGCGRKLNVNIAAAEAVQLVGAFSRPELLLKASANFERFMNDNRFHGAYGTRIKNQVQCAIIKLRGDPMTRRAVVTLWDPWQDNLPHMNDYPCTVALQFEMHDGRLCMNVVMRSNDVWLGLPYDMFQFTQLQMSMANSLGIGVGWYRHTALSLHMYKRDLEAAERVHSPTDVVNQPEGIGQHGVTTWQDVRARAYMLTLPDAELPTPMTSSEEWYRERFASYVG